MNTKKVCINVGPRGGLQVEYYIGEKKVSPFSFAKSNSEDLTHEGNKKTLGMKFLSKIQYNKRVELNREAHRSGIGFWAYGYRLFLESFRK